MFSHSRVHFIHSSRNSQCVNAFVSTSICSIPWFLIRIIATLHWTLQCRLCGLLREEVSMFWRTASSCLLNKRYRHHLIITIICWRFLYSWHSRRRHCDWLWELTSPVVYSFGYCTKKAQATTVTVTEQTGGGDTCGAATLRPTYSRAINFATRQPLF